MLISHPVFWVLVAAVAAPLLAEIPLGFRVPVVVLEVMLGIVIGPHVLGLVRFEGFLATMFTFGMAATLFMAGMELDSGASAGARCRLPHVAGSCRCCWDSPWWGCSMSSRRCTRR